MFSSFRRRRNNLDNAKKQLYLHIIINENNGNNENKEEKQKEEYDIKTQLSNIQQISNEIREINRQILNLNQKKEINEEEKNSEEKNTIQNEKNDSNSSKTTNISMQSKKILYFILEDEFYEKKKEEIKLKPQLNSNFYLTQKLKTLIPSNFDVKFKIFKEEDNFNDFFVKENNLININFLYLGSKRIKDKVFDFCGWGKDGNEIKDGDENKNPMKGKVGIKILLLGYIEEKEKIEKITNEYIKNIIYIPKNEEIDFAKEDDYSKKTYNYYFKNYFIEFVHEFMSQLTTKCDYCPINDAFNTAKRNFVSKFKRILTLLQGYDLVKLQSAIEDDNFDNEVLDIDEILNNDKKIINDIYDEYEYEYNKIKNIYYRKNPFSEGNEIHLKKRKYEKFMQLPGIGNLKPKNFLSFVEKDIYNALENFPYLKEGIIDKIKNNNKFNIYDNENVFDLGDELCKYFYMQEDFRDGIYIVSPSFLESFIKEKRESKKTNNRILILLKLLDTNNKENIINLINEVTNEKQPIAQFLVCSEEKLFDEGISLKNKSEIKINN